MLSFFFIMVPTIVVAFKSFQSVRSVGFRMLAGRIDLSSSDLAQLKTRNGIVVDKTRSIERCILKADSGPYVFVARPRRFGKSTTCSVTKAAFSGAAGRDLLKDTYPGQGERLGLCCKPMPCY